MTTNPQNSPNVPGTQPIQGTQSGKDAAQDAARQEAGQLGHEAKDAARDVAGTVREEATHVKDEAVQQVKSLAGTAKEEVGFQLAAQQERLAGQSRTVSDDLERIARGEKPESDLVTQAVGMISERARTLTEQLETKEPADLLEDVRRFAARRPGTFLAIAAGIGLVAGRLTRGLKDAQDDSQTSGELVPRRTYGSPAPVPAAAPPAYAPQDTLDPEAALITGAPTVEGTPGVPGAPGAPGVPGVPGTQNTGGRS
ncbi:hypothetical protein AB0E44_11690 [Micrococcus terreus]|uniref:hypothetical protein n=1 Tax=Micrococcus terreus TaxID=574650 RepID=UPI0033E11A1E